MPFIEEDKQGHFNLGTQAGLLGLLIWPHWSAAVVLATAAGIYKECRDYLDNCDARMAGKPDPHSVELLDAAATAAGGCWVAFVFWILK